MWNQIWMLGQLRQLRTGLSEEAGVFYYVGAFWSGLGLILLFSFRENAFWGTGCIMGGLLWFHPEDSMVGTRSGQRDKW